MQAQEAMRQDSAAQERAQLLLDEAGSGLVPTLRACEEGLEVLADHLVEQGSLGLVALILDGGGPSRDRVLHGDRSNFGAIPKRAVEGRSRAHCCPPGGVAHRRPCRTTRSRAKPCTSGHDAAAPPSAQQAQVGQTLEPGAPEGPSPSWREARRCRNERPLRHPVRSCSRAPLLASNSPSSMSLFLSHGGGFRLSEGRLATAGQPPPKLSPPTARRLLSEVDDK